MSSLIVEVCEVDAVEKHPHADKMEIATVKGWRTCVGKGQMKQGDKCVFIPPDSILPIALSDRLNVTKYLTPVKNENGSLIGARVRVAKLRGEPSYGLTMAVEDTSWGVGHDVASHYGITKWQPPMECEDGDAAPEHPAFHKYYELENIENFPGVIKDGEEVVFTEKIHGKNCRLGLIRDTNDEGKPVWRFMAGSHDVRRKELETRRKRRVEIGPDGKPITEQTLKNVRDEKGKVVIDKVSGREMVELVTVEKEWSYEVTNRSPFWEVLDTKGVKNLLVRLCNGQNNVILFGEWFGCVGQDMTYGMKNGESTYRVFDISVNGKYLNFDEKVAACKNASVEMVPVLYRGPFSMKKVEEHISGPTTICSVDNIEGFKGREGIVITTTDEHPVETTAKFFSRAAVKAVSFAYLERTGGTEQH